MRLKFTFYLLAFSCAFFSVSAQNTALSFNGGTQSVTTSSFIVPTSGDFTVEFWGLLPSPGTGLQEFVSQGQSGGGFYIGTNNDIIRAGDNWINTGVAFPLDKWTHVALVNSLGTATLYLNGVNMGSSSSYSITALGSNFTVGQQFAPFNEPLTATIDQLRIWSIARTASQIKQGMYGVVDPATAGLVADYPMDEGSGTTMGNVTATAGLNGTLVNTPAWVNSPVQFGQNALNFDGVDDQVIVPNNPIFDISTGTIEAWINPSVLNATNMEIAGNRSGGNTRYSVHVSSSGLGIWNGSNFGTVAVVIPTNTWTLVSFVCDGTNTIAYVNGSLVGTLLAPGAVPVPFGTATGMTFDMGISKNCCGDAEAFQGSIDEVRVWSTQQTPAQITTYMNNTLTGSEPGLLALYSFDQGNPGNDNTDLLTAIDNTANANNGTLMNFAMTGATSNFVTHLLAPLPVNFSSFTATKAEGEVVLQWQTAQEQNSRDFSIERSLDGSHYSSIGTVAAAGNSSTTVKYSFTDPAPAAGLNYYRLNETDLDGRSMYSTVKTVTFATNAVQKLSWSIISGGQAAELNLTEGSNEFYTLMDVGGRNLAQGQLSSGKLILNHLAGGIYIVKIMTFTGRQLNAKMFIP